MQRISCLVRLGTVSEFYTILINLHLSYGILSQKFQITDAVYDCLMLHAI